MATNDDNKVVSGDAMALAWEVGANSKNKAIAELVAENERLRGLIAGLECEAVTNWSAAFDCLREFPDDNDKWCPVCAAKAAADKPDAEATNAKP